MEQLKQILTDHARRYPQMAPTDAVKLIYQNEFGGGHLIRDEKACLEYLQREYKSVKQTADHPLAESIGNGLVRIHLAALDAHGYSVDQLGADFIYSARIQRGCLDRFLQKLQLLEQLTGEGVFPFSTQALQEYLAEYQKAGYPMVSHSTLYRAAYAPAYRIVSETVIHRKFTA